MRRLGILLIGLLLLSLYSLLGISAESPQNEPFNAELANADWTIETIELPGGLGSEIGLALSTNGTPHVTYMANPLSRIHYAMRQQDAWHIQTVASGPASPSMTIDSANRLHVAYTQSGRLWYAYQPQSGSPLTLVPTCNPAWPGCPSTSNPSLVLDAAGRAHILYEHDKSDGGEAVYIVEGATPGEWTKSIAGKPTSYSQQGALALDSQNRPHIVYADQYDFYLRYGRLTDSGWITTTINRDSSPYVALALGPNDTPHIVYWRHSGGLAYATQQNGEWRQEGIADIEQTYSRFAMDIDSKGHPHVSFFCSGLCYGWRDDQGWHTQVVSPGQYVGRYSSIKLDSADRPHIAFEADGDAKYAMPSGAQIQPDNAVVLPSVMR